MRITHSLTHSLPLCARCLCYPSESYVRECFSVLSGFAHFDAYSASDSEFTSVDSRRQRLLGWWAAGVDGGKVVNGVKWEKGEWLEDRLGIK